MNNVIDAENLTPAQKAAATRKRNAEAKKAAAAVEVDAVAAVVEAPASVKADIPGVLDEVTAVINGAADNPDVVIAVTKVTSAIPARVRTVLYQIGIWLGIAATIAGPVVAGLTGQTAVIGASAVGLALALSNLLANKNLSKTATDLAAEKPVPAVG